MTPKSLLRLSEAGSHVGELLTGEFLPVIGDTSRKDDAPIHTVLLCSGRVYYDLAAQRNQINASRTAILRVEQYYPFPRLQLQRHLASFQQAQDVRWVQEEPANMGAWSFMEPRLRAMLGPGQTLRYVGRPESASPATGSHTVYEMERHLLLREAFSNESKH
jgi:2-oxoglutarate dehydrogenase E1 component